MTKPLSPAAQTIYDAAVKAQYKSYYTQFKQIAAAALRAAADLVVPLDPCGNDAASPQCEQIRADLLAIAAELEAQ